MRAGGVRVVGRVSLLGELQSVLDLLRQHDGLIILGDSSAGKTTFLKYLALPLAARAQVKLGLEERLPILADLSLGERLPILAPLSS